MLLTQRYFSGHSATENGAEPAETGGTCGGLPAYRNSGLGGLIRQLPHWEILGLAAFRLAMKQPAPAPHPHVPFLFLSHLLNLNFF